MDDVGIEPTTSRMRSERSTPELDAQHYIVLSEVKKDGSYLDEPKRDPPFLFPHSIPSSETQSQHQHPRRSSFFLQPTGSTAASPTERTPILLEPSTEVAVSATVVGVATIASVNVSDSPQISALLDLYNALNISNSSCGASWRWDTVPSDLWYGLSLSPTGDVAGLQLRGCGLSGSLPASIFSLSALQSIDLRDNHMHSSLPTASDPLLQLTSFQVGGNSLTGSLPLSWLRSWRLQEIDLSNNRFRGTIPDIIGNLSRIERLAISHNSFTGPLPDSLFTLSTLTHLDFSFTGVSGSIPSLIGSLLSLESLVMSTSSISGSIPSAIAALSRLQLLHLSTTSVTGSLPRSFLHLISLQDFIGADCQLTGSIPEELGTMAELKYFNIARNHFTGKLPSSINSSSSSAVQLLSLSLNHLSGSIPEVWGDAMALQSLYLDRNELTGLLPTRLQQLPSLDALVVIANSLTGSLPASWCDVTSLQMLMTSENLFSCVEPCIPVTGYHDALSLNSYLVCKGIQDEALCNLARDIDINAALPDEQAAYPIVVFEPNVVQFEPVLKYEYYNAKATRYEVSFDASVLLGNQRFFDYYAVLCHGVQPLDPTMACTTFTDDWPGVHFNRALEVTSQYLSIAFYRQTLGGYNDIMPGFKFTVQEYYATQKWACTYDNDGTVSVSVATTATDAAVGNEVGRINPCTWHGIRCLENAFVTAVVLPSLSLAGSFSAYFFDLHHLNHVDFSHNYISGSLPDSIQYLQTVEYIDLSNNRLTGSIPSTISLMTNLVEVYLDSNSITGSIPLQIQALSLVRVLDLRSNLFTGEVDAGLCQFISNVSVFRIDKNPGLTCMQPCSGVTIPAEVVDLETCRPTTEPTAAPFTPGSSSSEIKLTTGALTGIVIAGVFVLVTVALAIYCGLKSGSSHLALGLPIHHAVAYKQPITEYLLEAHLQSAKRRDKHGKTAIELIIAMQGSYQVSDEAFYVLMTDSLHFNPVTGELLEDVSEHNYAWSILITQSSNFCFTLVDRVLQEHIDRVHLLTTEVDAFGRRFIDLASPRCREAMNKCMYLHRRFELLPGPPEHKSATSLVCFAIDHRTGANGLDANEKVALKFMKHRHQYLSEISARTRANFSAEFVILVRESYDGMNPSNTENVLFRQSATKKGFADYPYCLVMNVGMASLQRFILQQNMVGEWDTVKWTVKSIAQCLLHVHSKDFIHGDLKPLNILSTGKAFRLIDLDASVCCHPSSREFAGAKFSSAYSPPELFFKTAQGQVVIKTFDKHSCTGLPVGCEVESDGTFVHPLGYSLVPASASIDMWALGAVMYLLCTGVTLFQASIDDNIPTADMHLVYSWSERMKEEKLSLVQDKYARNLLSLLLDKDPTRRLDAGHVLSHPFISGMQPERMIGEQAAFDVFLSYRVDSDSQHVEMLYNVLTGLGLTVWWDKVCLLPGQPWEEGFCDGLVNSSCFVCLLSRNAINHPEKAWQNFGRLEEGSRCDNVLLEWRLALELRERRMIEGVFPVFIGDLQLQDSSSYSSSGGLTDSPTTAAVYVYSDYFSSGGHPVMLPEVAVEAVELKLRDHLHRQGLGLPLESSRTVKQVVADVTANQGGFWKGEVTAAVDEICGGIVSMRRQLEKRTLYGSSTSTRFMACSSLLDHPLTEQARRHSRNSSMRSIGAIDIGGDNDNDNDNDNDDSTTEVDRLQKEVLELRQALADATATAATSAVSSKI